MKKIGFLALVPVVILSACGSTPSQVTGDGRVSIGVAAADGESSETATKTVVAATDTSPAQVSWTVTAGKGVTFTFMTAPGSDAAYITGYQIKRQEIRTVNGTTISNTFPLVSKSNVYVPSGFYCASRTSLRSCSQTDTDMVPGNGVPVQMNIYLENGLGSLARSTNNGVSMVTDIDFIGKSSNGADVIIPITNVVSQGIRAGVD